MTLRTWERGSGAHTFVTIGLFVTTCAKEGVKKNCQIRVTSFMDDPTMSRFIFVGVDSLNCNSSWPVLLNH